MRKLAAEALGTFFLVYAGTSAIIVNSQTAGAVTLPGVALAFGLIVMAMVYALGDVSGSHLNPAVTIGFAVSGRFALREVPGYVIAQVAGAIVASLLVRLLFPGNATLGATIPSGAAAQSFVMEGVLTFLLMLVILAVSSGPKERGMMAGIAIGGTVCLAALIGGPVSGASMNPARSIAPALVVHRLDSLWVYLVGPIAGAALAAPTFRFLRPHGAMDETRDRRQLEATTDCAAQ